MLLMAPIVCFGSDADFPRACAWNCFEDCSDPIRLPRVSGAGSGGTLPGFPSGEQNLSVSDLLGNGVFRSRNPLPHPS